MTQEEAVQKLDLAETKFREAVARHEQTQQQLLELEERRESVLGKSEQARRAMADYGRLIEQSRKKLAALKVEEARVALAEAIQLRDAILAKTAVTLNSAVSLLEMADAKRGAVAEAHQRLTSLDHTVGRAAPEEPDILHEPWQRMVAAVKPKIDQVLESDIADAAARSNLPGALDALPQHPRIHAAERRKQWHRERIQQEQNHRERNQAAKEMKRA
jgi:hypothetical protein